MNVASTRTGPGTGASSGEQVEHRDRRRKFRRYPARWKAALVFDKAQGRPTLHATTVDLSVGGASIVAGEGDLAGCLVTLLLARPARPGAEPYKAMKLRAQVISSIHVPSLSGYRHGLKFVPSEGDDLGLLAGIINAAEAARRGPQQAAPAAAAPAVSQPVSAPVPASAPTSGPPDASQPTSAPVGEPPAFKASPGSLLARLQEAAREKLREQQNEAQSEERRAAQRVQAAALVGKAVESAYQHLKEVVALLDTVKPAYASDYALLGLPGFDGLAWKSVSLDFQVRELSPTARAFEQVSLQYHLAAGKVLSVVREIPADEKLKRMLEDAKVGYSTRREKNNQGALTGTRFDIPCEVQAALQLTANFDTGKLALKLRNVGQFGTAEYVLSPDVVTREALDELVHFILGETRQIGALIPKGA